MLNSSRCCNPKPWSGVIIGAWVIGIGPRAAAATPESDAFFARMQRLIGECAPQAKLALPTGPEDVMPEDVMSVVQRAGIDIPSPAMGTVGATA